MHILMTIYIDDGEVELIPFQGDLYGHMANILDGIAYSNASLN